MQIYKKILSLCLWILRFAQNDKREPAGDLALPRGYQKGPGVFRRQGLRRTAATYSPNWWVSTIGVGELNFSVRNGKRWFLTAITTAVYDLREKTSKLRSDR